MNLHIKERLYLLQLLPSKCTFADFVTKKSIVEKIQISDVEKKELNIEISEDQKTMTWDNKKDQDCPLAVEFTSAEGDLIKRSCEKLVDVAYPDDFWNLVEKIYDSFK